MNAYQIVLRPWVTEKATALGEDKTYVFEVAIEANKIQIRSAVEELFDVQVDGVQTVNVKGKYKRRRTRRGIIESVSKTRKKAYVRLKRDSKPIELFEGA
ncbi:MAG: 50S ribosomal protein L23 [Herpetosiphon sp.]